MNSGINPGEFGAPVDALPTHSHGLRLSRLAGWLVVADGWRTHDLTMTTLAQAQIDARVCYLETIGRVSGTPHEIEIWFAADGDTIWMLSGGHDRSDWVRNLRQNPAVRIRIADGWVTGSAEVVSDPARDQRAREQIAAKYYGWRSGPLPNEWTRTALPIAVTLRG